LAAASDVMIKARRNKLRMRLFCNADREWNARVLNMCVALCAVLLTVSALTAVAPLLWGNAASTAADFDYAAQGFSNISNIAASGAIAGSDANAGANFIALTDATTGADNNTGAGHVDELQPLQDVQHGYNGYIGIAQPSDETVLSGDTDEMSVPELVHAGEIVVELIDWTTARGVVQKGEDMQVVDVHTGITFYMRSFSIGGHADVEPVTIEDTDAILESRNGIWSWTPRPVWVTVGGRTFAAALNGMPHSGSTIDDNGMNGHLCLHFNNTRARSRSYQSNLNDAVVEAWEARLNPWY